MESVDIKFLLKLKESSVNSIVFKTWRYSRLRANLCNLCPKISEVIHVAISVIKFLECFETIFKLLLT